MPDGKADPEERLPAPEGLRKLAEDALESLRAAQMQLQHDTTALEAERVRFEQDRAQLARLEQDVKTLQRELEDQQQELTATARKLGGPASQLGSWTYGYGRSVMA